jgi:hypothetical protein
MNRLASSLLRLAPLALGLAGCRGPDPAITRQELRPPAAEGAPYQAVLTVENKGGGEGEIAITARIRARATGQTAAQRAETLDLLPHETTEVILELRPTVPAPFDLSTEARYPP